MTRFGFVSSIEEMEIFLSCYWILTLFTQLDVKISWFNLCSDDTACNCHTLPIYQTVFVDDHFCLFELMKRWTLSPELVLSHEYIDSELIRVYYLCRSGLPYQHWGEHIHRIFYESVKMMYWTIHTDSDEEEVSIATASLTYSQWITCRRTKTDCL